MSTDNVNFTTLRNQDGTALHTKEKALARALEVQKRLKEGEISLRLPKSISMIQAPKSTVEGGRVRIIPFQKTCSRALQAYLTERGELSTQTLFVSIDNHPLRIRSLQDRIHDYGLMAKITGVRVSPHTFRHTMSKMYIRNGGDPFSLQQILGHSTLDMLQTYVRLFNNEVREQHRKYSPVEHIQTRRKR